MADKITQKTIVGITGGIGSGKSLISQIFNSLHIPIYNSDKEAKKLYDLKHIREFVIKNFGIETYTGEKLNKDHLAKIVFSDKNNLRRLNQVIHPELAIHFENWVKIQNSSLAIKEAAILIESGAYKNCDFVINGILKGK